MRPVLNGRKVSPKTPIFQMRESFSFLLIGYQVPMEDLSGWNSFFFLYWVSLCHVKSEVGGGVLCLVKIRYKNGYVGILSYFNFLFFTLPYPTACTKQCKKLCVVPEKHNNTLLANFICTVNVALGMGTRP